MIKSDLTGYIVTVRDPDGNVVRKTMVYAKSKAAACSILLSKTSGTIVAEVAAVRCARAA